jgi:hypothetical protein
MEIDRDPLSNAIEEVKELERLLREAKKRLRFHEKRYLQQGWLDWIYEQLGWV